MKHLKELAEKVCSLPLEPREIVQSARSEQGFKIYPYSFRFKDRVLFYTLRVERTDYLILVSSQPVTWDFRGETASGKDKHVLICRETLQNCRQLCTLFPDLNPSPIGKGRSTFGVGDRLGVAAPGHLMAFSCYAFVPILAQQSLRELQLTGRTYRNVVDAAVWGVFKDGYKGLWGADGDHLKDEDSVRTALEQGCTMITADLSDHLRLDIHQASEGEVKALYKKIPESYRHRVEEYFLPLKNCGSFVPLDYSEQTLARIALTYRSAVDFAKKLYEAGRDVRENFDFEISVDETSVATSVEAHFFIASELSRLGVPFTGIAPCYVGEFQKGIDYIGNLSDFAEDFVLHADLAAAMGHKISVHSSSDKFSVYPIMKDKLSGPCHLKTSGTNWLIALQVVASAETDVFRDLFNEAYKVYETAKEYYHITPDLFERTEIEDVGDQDLLKVFENDTDRQVMHVAYGELKKNRKLWERFESVLSENIDLYWMMLESHIGRHLFLLS